MIINGNLTGYVRDGMFLVLIGTFGWLANKADTKVEKHEDRIQAVELSDARLEPKIDYIVKSVNELKADMKEIKRNGGAR